MQSQSNVTQSNRKWICEGLWCRFNDKWCRCDGYRVSLMMALLIQAFSDGISINSCPFSFLSKIKMAHNASFNYIEPTPLRLNVPTMIITTAAELEKRRTLVLLWNLRITRKECGKCAATRYSHHTILRNSDCTILHGRKHGAWFTAQRRLRRREK